MDKREQIVEAAIRVVSRYGVKRTTMSDVAAEADMARQTLYNAYASKDELLREMIRYTRDQSLCAIQSDVAGAGSLGDKLDIVFEHHVIKPYEWLNSAPDAADIVEGFNAAACEELAASYDAHRKAIRKLLTPHADAIRAAGLSVNELADFVQSSAAAAKKIARSKKHLVTLLKTLRTLVLTLAESNKPQG